MTNNLSIPPTTLQGHRIAMATWKEAISKSGSMTAFDQGLLTQYCLLVDEEAELESLVVDLGEQIQQLQELTNESELSPQTLQSVIKGTQKNLMDLQRRLREKREFRFTLARSLGVLAA